MGNRVYPLIPYPPFDATDEERAAFHRACNRQLADMRAELQQTRLLIAIVWSVGLVGIGTAILMFLH